MYVWGTQVDNNTGLEIGSTTTPTLLLSGVDVINVFSGNYSSCSLVQTRDGKMYGWGKNTDHKFLGNIGTSGKDTISTNMTVVTTPTLIDELEGIAIRNVDMSYTCNVIVLETRRVEFAIKNRDKFVDVIIKF